MKKKIKNFTLPASSQTVSRSCQLRRYARPQFHVSILITPESELNKLTGKINKQIKTFWKVVWKPDEA